VRRGRFVSLVFLLGVGEQDYLVSIESGRVVDISPRALATTTGRFTIRADASTWLEHWKPMPVRDYHDLFSMLPKRLAVIDGDLLPLMQNLQYFKDVLSSIRGKGVSDATV
jgi:hypothetical protein